MIATLAVIYPYYLFEKANSTDFNTFIDCYLSILVAVWGQDVKIRVISKGQAAAIYVCKPFLNIMSGKIQ